MIKRLIRGIALSLAGSLLLVMPVLASTITGATYKGDVTITNASTLATMVSVPFTLSTPSLVTNGYIEADCLNTSMQINGADVAYMPGYNANPWVVYVSSIANGSNIVSKLYTGGPDMGGKIRYFPAAGGMTPNWPITGYGTGWSAEIKGYFDTSFSGSSRYIASYASGATFDVYVSAANTITALMVASGKSVVAAGVTSGEHTLKYAVTATDLEIYWDGVLKDTEPLLGASTAGGGIQGLFLNSTMPYVEYYKCWHGATLEEYNTWEYGTTFSDLSGNGHIATPALRTTSSDADVSAALTSFVPTGLSSASITPGATVALVTSADVPDIADFPSMYDEGETGGFWGFEDLLNPALATADIPEAMFWYPIAFVIAISLGFGAFAMTKQLVVQAVVSGVVMACFAGGGVLGDGLIPYWTVIIFGVEALLIILIQEHQKA